MTKQRKVRVKIDVSVDDYQVFACGTRQIRDGNCPLYTAYQHRLLIRRNYYSFITDGNRQWSFKGDTVSFEWSFCKLGKYRNIYPDTFMACDPGGNEVIRGNSYEQQCKRMWGVDPHEVFLVLGSKCCMAPEAGRKDCDPDCILRQSYEDGA